MGSSESKQFSTKLQTQELKKYVPDEMGIFVITQEIECFSVINFSVYEPLADSFNRDKTILEVPTREVPYKALCKVKVPPGAKVERSFFGTFTTSNLEVTEVLFTLCENCPKVKTLTIHRDYQQEIF